MITVKLVGDYSRQTWNQVVDTLDDQPMFELMNENDRTPGMPVVNLMDPSVEPTEAELKMMMVDVQARATRKWQRVYAAYWDEIDAGIRALR